MPQAPTHVLVIPREHQPNVVALALSSPQTVVDLLEAVGAVATWRGSKLGTAACSTPAPWRTRRVFHAHVHVLGGRAMTWPPG